MVPVSSIGFTLSLFISYILLGTWLPWGNYYEESKCSVTCGLGMSKRKRVRKRLFRNMRHLHQEIERKNYTCQLPECRGGKMT